jgi:hypothetical protein
MPNETTYKRGARVWMINCMGVPNEAAEGDAIKRVWRRYEEQTNG